MKTKLFLLMFVLFFCALTATAQESLSEGQLFFVLENQVIPSRIVQYEKASNDLIGLFNRHKIPMSFFAASTQDFVYYYFTPVEDYTGASLMDNIFGLLREKIGTAAYNSILGQFDGCYNSRKTFMIRQYPELSYKPEYGSQISDGLNFRHWTFYFVQAGKEKEAIAIAREWKALYTKHNITEGYQLYMGDIGTDMPLIFVATPAKNAGDYYTKLAAQFKIFGQEGQAILDETWTALWKYDSKDAYIRPNLSHLVK